MNNAEMYDTLFSIMDFELLIVFEDDFMMNSGGAGGQSILRGLARMPKHELGLIYAKLESVDTELFEQTRAFVDFYRDSFPSEACWADVPREELADFSLFEKDAERELNALYASVDLRMLQEKCGEILFECGIGAIVPSLYAPLVDSWRNEDHGRYSRPLRIYRNLEAARGSLPMVLGESGYKKVLCIIDDQLCGTPEANHVVSFLIEQKRAIDFDVAGVILSTKDIESEITSEIYFEHVSKSDLTTLRSALLQSSYAQYLRALRKHMEQCVDEAFRLALTNKEVARFLAEKSANEGMSEHQVVTDWISALVRGTAGKAEATLRLMSLAKVTTMDTLVNEDFDAPMPDELEMYETYAAFDYSVNARYEPIAVGDVFESSDGKRYWVLCGQECDIVDRGGGSRKNPIAVLLSATCDPRTKGENAFIKESFREVQFDGFRRSIDSEEPPMLLSVNCCRERYLTFAALDLCSYNHEGRCSVSLDGSLDDLCQQILPQKRKEYYRDLVERFACIVENESLVNQLDVFKNSYVAQCHYDKETNAVDFGLRRLCRLNKEYASHVNEVHLTHGQRRGYGIADLSGWYTWYVNVEYEGQSGSLLVRRDKPISMIGQLVKLHQCCWIVEQADMDELLGKFELSVDYEKTVLRGGRLVLSERSGAIGKCEDGKTLCYEKKNKGSILSLKLGS